MRGSRRSEISLLVDLGDDVDEFCWWNKMGQQIPTLRLYATHEQDETCSDVIDGIFNVLWYAWMFGGFLERVYARPDVLHGTLMVEGQNEYAVTGGDTTLTKSRHLDFWSRLQRTF
jgi:hypothetical protein